MSNLSKKKYALISSIVLILIISLAVFSKVVVAAPPDVPPGLLKAMEVQEANTPALMEDPDVVGTAVSEDEDGNPVIKVFLANQGVIGLP